MKKLVSMLLAVVMLVGVFAVAAAAEESSPYKVAILTGTTSQGDEEYYAAEALKEKYPDIVLHDTYPDNFSSEVETTISKLLTFAEDPEVKAIIFVQGVQGATAAFNQIKEKRPDILLVCGVPAEDPAPLGAAADIILANDEVGCGYQVADLAYEWDCEVLIHYSFPRHLGYETIAGKRVAMKDTAETYGIEFVDRDCPDPTGDAGMSGAQAYILEDVPKVMAEYAGKKVCFYCTNCGMQVALQQAVLEQEDAYYALPCCPSPFHAFQQAFGLESTSQGDIGAALTELANFLDGKDATGRFSTWSLPVNMSMIAGMFDYACKYAEGEIEGKVDEAVMSECIAAAAGLESIELAVYTAADGSTVDNYYLMALEPINFADYVG